MPLHFYFLRKKVYETKECLVNYAIVILKNTDYVFIINRASIIQQEITKVGKVNEESIYKPVLIRGVDGKS